MKTQKLLVTVASVCLMAFLTAGSAYAQEAPIIAAYLAEFQENLDETLGDVQDISGDLRQCFDRFEDCTDRFGADNSVVECLSDFIPCVSRESSDKERTCSSFLDEFRGDYRRALRDARREGVEEEFEDSEAVRGTVGSALGIASLCY